MSSLRVPRDVVLAEGYKGNVNLKRQNVPIEWTPALEEEWDRCAADPLYFANNYIKIVSLDHGLIQLVLRDYQVEMMTSMFTQRNVVMGAARQCGKTTTVVAFVIHSVLFNDHYKVGILANKKTTAVKILAQVRLAYQHLPKWMQQGVVEWNKGEIVLENGSSVSAEASSSDAIRGWSMNLLFIDELAFIKNWDDFASSVLPTISSGKTTKLVYVSTPNGLNHFYKIFTDAQNGRNDFYPIEVPWQRVPGRDEAWKRKILRTDLGGDLDKFAQEYEVQFLGSSGTLIAGWKLKQLLHVEPLAQTEFGLRQYERPEPGRIYALVADVSYGKGLDNSAFSVMDVTELPYRQVCTFYNNQVEPADYAGVIYRVATMYNTSMVFVETAVAGGEVANLLFDEYGYENLVCTISNGKGGRIAGVGLPGGEKRVERGIVTTNRVKTKGCSLLKMVVENDQLLLRDEITIDELKRFSKKNGQYQAEEGAHDDSAMGLVLFSWLSSQAYFKEVVNSSVVKQTRQIQEELLMQQTLPFGFVDDGRTDHELEDDVLALARSSRPPRKDRDSWLRDG
jgi:hypothetical protein